jgi:hypothetical protein
MTGKPKPKPEPAPLPEPGPATKALIAEAKERNAKRPLRPQVSSEMKAKNVFSIGPQHNDGRGWQEVMLDAFGTTSTDFLDCEISSISTAQSPAGEPDPKETPKRLNYSLAAIAGAKPANEIEAMLASQMVVTHSLAMDMLGRTKRAEYRSQQEATGSLGVKLLRTYTMQVEAFAKLKRGGEQTVRVEHVHVYPGGQAVVGNVNSPAQGDGAQNKTGGQPHALGYAPGVTMPRQVEAEREAMPVASGARE